MPRVKGDDGMDLIKQLFEVEARRRCLERGSPLPKSV